MREKTPRQEELLDHAMLLVREVGLSGLTVRRLAERVGFSEAALYRHFPSKAALLEALAERLREARLLGPIREIAADEEQPAAQRLCRVVRHHVGTILDLDGLPLLILAEAALSGEDGLLRRFQETIEELLAILGALVVEYREDTSSDDERPVRHVASLLVGLPAATGFLHRISRDASFEAEARGRLADDYVRRLLAPREDAA